MSEQQPDKKIIVDEDWKSQVEADKEAARQGESGAKPAPGPTSGQQPSLPPADLIFLVGTLYVQGAMSLGLLPNPVTKKAERHVAQAKHAIDMLAMLQQKTEGNRTPEETAELENVLHELRMAFIQTATAKE
ncbi:MAG: DUF1844 domain-containing protein [Planctomycetaceae bacterium]|nr:DUF1844 domain-containing protein [Planctomycetaceae bacterium]